MKSARYCPACETVWDLSHGDFCPRCPDVFTVRVWDYGEGFVVYQAQDLPLSALEVDPE